MRNNGLGIRKKLRAALAVVLSFQMAFGSLVPVYAAPEDDSLMLADGWEVEKENDNLVLNKDGSVTIRTEAGTIGDANGIKNTLYMPLPTSTDYEFSVKVNGTFGENFNGAYLMITSGKNLADAVGIVRRHHGYLGGDYGSNELMGIMYNGGEHYESVDFKDVKTSTATDVYGPTTSTTAEEFYLKLKKQNGRITGYYAKEYTPGTDGWNQIIDDRKFPLNAEGKDMGAAYNNSIYLALGACNGGGTAQTSVTFSDVRVGGEQIELAVNPSGFYNLKLEAASKELDYSATTQLTATAYDGKGGVMQLDKVTYTSDDTTIATVSDTGVVTAGTKLGKVVITAEATIGAVTKKATVKIQVGKNTVTQSWKATSPDGNTVITANLMQDKTLFYTASQDGKVTIPDSPVGLVTNLGDFSKNLVFKETKTESVSDEYTMYSGKREQYSDAGEETTVTFTLEDDSAVEFDFIIRAYDDGVAYRYAVRSTDEKELTISDETTGLQLPEEATIYWMNYQSATWNYESQYEKTTTEELTVGTTPSVPFMYIKDDIMTLFTEADLIHGTYPGSMLTTGEDGLMGLTFAKSQTGDVVTTTPFASPWRVAITGQAEDIVENTLVESLNPPADEDTYKFSEWVEPGLSSWSWVANWGSGISDQSIAETHIKWIDLAEEMGWKYYILDEGWASNGRGKLVSEGWERDWFKDVAAYAAEKDVKLIAWVHVSDIDTAEEREKLFGAWQKAGIQGIKPDFFDSENQDTTKLYEGLYKDAASHRLMINVHGANKPTGEIRTWPNVYGREAVAGQEQGGLLSEQYTIIPFIRAAIGPTEVTEELNSKDYNKTTMGFQVALTTLVENGLHSLGSAPDVYLNNAVAKEYYKNYPDGWVETKYVAGEIGNNVHIAREAKNHEWYLSGISVGTDVKDTDNAVDYKVPLTFLEAEKDYVAFIYCEDGRRALKRESQIVESTDELDVSMLYGGGYAVRFVPQETAKNDAITEITASKVISLEKKRTTTVPITTAPADAAFSQIVWTSEDPAVATVTANGEIKGVNVGVTTITAASAINPTVKAEISVTVTPERFELSDKWTINNGNDNALINDFNSVTITTESGVLGDDPETYHNLFGMKIPEGKNDFTVSARITGGLNADYQGGFIVVYDQNNPNGTNVSVGRRHHNWWANNHGGVPAKVGMMSKGGDTAEFYGNEEDPSKDVYVKIVKEGSKFRGFYSYDSINWKEITDNQKNSITHTTLAASKNLCVGFYGGSGGGNTAIDITFSEFSLDGELQNVAVYSESEQIRLEADKAAADEVIAKINAIGSVSLGSKDSIEAAKKAYSALTKAQQALVTNYATLTSAETKLAQLQKEKAEKDAAEKKAAEEAAKQEAERATLKKGKKVTIGDFTYKITKAGTTSKAGTVELVKPKKKTMKKVTIPATVEKAGITFKVTSIAEKAFQSNKNLTTVTIGKNVTKIGKKAFYKASKLKTVKVSSKSIKSVGKQAFKSVNKKIKITVPKAKKSAYKKLFKKGGVSSSKVK